MKKRIALFLAAVLVVMAFMTGCSSSNGGTTPTPTPTPTPKPADKQELVLNLGSEPPNLDSAKTTDSASFEILNNSMEGLIRLGEGFKLLPGIAEKWDCGASGLDCVFTLRKDAKWSDGKPVTSKDFAFGWLRALDPSTASDYAYQLYYITGGEEWNTLDIKAADFKTKSEAAKKLVKIETPDDYTLKVTLKSPTPYWLGLMAFPTYLPQRQDIVEKHKDKYASDAEYMVYNGPFTIENWTHESEILLKKNANYWDAKAVKLEKVTWKMVTDATTAINMYEAGELDEVGIPGDQIPAYKTKGLKTMAEATTTYLTFNTERKEFKNVNLRNAFSLAIDRQTFLDAIVKNGSVAALGFVPPSIEGDGGKKFREMFGGHYTANGNKDEAKKLWAQALKELGVDKLKVSILHTDTTNTKKWVQGIQAMLQDTLPGLTINLEATTFAVRLSRTRNADFDMVFQGWIGDFNDPMTFMNMFVTGGGYNDARWSNKDFDALIKKAEASSDNKVRMQAMFDAEKIFMKEMPILPILHNATNWVTKPYVKGILNFPLGGSTDLKNASIEGKTK